MIDRLARGLAARVQDALLPTLERAAAPVTAPRVPRALREPPRLDPGPRRTPIRARHALLREMEAAGRLLHRDWSRYDTAHVVFRPKHMSPEELAAGYAWIYRRLFSHGSIWRRRPQDRRAVLPYLAMSYLYKRSNPVWPLLIRSGLTAAAWRPLIEVSRRRHVAFRRRLAATPLAPSPAPRERVREPRLVVAAGV